MKRLLKGIGALVFISAVAGLVYNIVKAFKLKNEDDSGLVQDEDSVVMVKKCIFDEMKEELDVKGKEFVSLICHFGGMDLKINESESAEQELNVNVDVSFGGISLIVPNTWEVINETTCIVGGTEVGARQISEECSTLRLTGKILFGGVTITYEEPEEIVAGS
jgi:hypothetical protein